MSSPGSGVASVDEDEDDNGGRRALVSVVHSVVVENPKSAPPRISGLGSMAGDTDMSRSREGEPPPPPPQAASPSPSPNAPPNAPPNASPNSNASPHDAAGALQSLAWSNGEFGQLAITS